MYNERSPGSGPIYAAYTGPSMNPTLREPELMEIVPYGDRMVRHGDVVFFVPPGGGHPVVHRVVGVVAAGICTRGDNNALGDSWLLQPADVTGQVVAAWRGQKRRRVAGGWAGRLLGAWRRSWRPVDRGISWLLRPFYRALAQGGLVARLVPAPLKPRVVAYKADGRPHFQLLWGRRVIGRYDRQRGIWVIRRPFRLLVDERTLPKG